MKYDFFYTLVSNRCWKECEETASFYAFFIEGQLTLSIKSDNVTT